MDLPATYVALTEGLLRIIPISHPMAHLNGGLIIYLGMQYLMGERRAALVPLLAVAFAEGLNESIEAAYYGSWRIDDTLGDIGWTLFWPCMLYAHARYRRHRWAMAERRRALEGIPVFGAAPARA